MQSRRAADPTGHKTYHGLAVIQRLKNSGSVVAGLPFEAEAGLVEAVDECGLVLDASKSVADDAGELEQG